MNVLRVIATMDPAGGGPVEGLRRTAALHRENGVHTEVVCVDPPGPGGRISEEGLAIHALGPGRFGWGYSARLLPWLRENARRFDVILVHGLWLYPSFAVWRLWRMRAAGAPPYFVLPHGMLDPWFQRREVRPVKAIRNTIYWKLVEHRVIRDAEAVLFTCEEERRLARLPFRPYRCRERVIAYGTAAPPARTEDAPSARELFPELRGRPYLLFLSRIHPKKGLELLLRAYARVFGEAGGVVPALLIAGPCADPHYRTALMGLAEDLGLAPEAESGGPARPQVVWSEMLTGEAKWAAFFDCAAFVLPSHQENFGIAVVEAMACGKPVLISDKVNIWREIQEDGAGIVAEDTLSGVESLLGQWSAMTEEESAAMGERARGAFARRYEIHRAAQSLLDAVGPRGLREAL